MRLPVAGNHIAGPLRHDGGGFEVVGLYQKALTGINVAPHVSRGLTTNFTDPRHERFGVETFRDAMAPGQ
jgi:hypothetical protein